MELGAARGSIQILFDPAGVNQATSALNGLNGASDGTGAKVQGMSLKAAAGFGLIGYAAKEGFGAIIGSAAGFEKQMNAVQASTGATESEMASLSATALRLGQETQFSATEAGGAIEDLAKLGVSTADINNGVADATVNLAAATGESLGSSAEALGQNMNLFQDDAAKYGSVAERAAAVTDSMTAAINASATDLPDFQAGMRNLAPAVQLGAVDSFTDGAAAIAYFTKFGLKGADVGVSLARTFTQLSQGVGPAADEMNRLGISAFDASGNFLPLPDIMDNVAAATAGMTEEERTNALTKIFGAEAADVMAIALKNGGAGLRDMTKEVEANGQAQAAANARMQGFTGAVEQLKGSLETAAIAIGSKLTPALTVIADGITAAVNAFFKLPEPIQNAIAAAIAFAAILTGIGAAVAVAGPVLAALGVIVGTVGAPFLLTALAIGVLAAAFGGPILDAAGELANYLKRVVETQNTFNAALDSLPASIQPAAEALGRIVDAVADLYRAFQAGGLSGLMAALPGELQQIVTALGDLAVELVNWTIDVGAPTITGWIADGAGWLVSQLQSLIEGAGGLITRLANWFIEVAVPQLTGWIQAGSDWLMTELQAAAEGAAGLTVRLANWFIEVAVPQLTGWVQAGASWLVTELQAAAEGAAGLTVRLANWFIEVAVPQLSGWVQDGAGWLSTQLQAAAEGASGLTVRLANWFIEVAIPQLTGWVQAGAEWLGTALQTAAEGAVGLTVRLANWFIEVAIPQLTGWVQAGASWLSTALQTAAEGAAGIIVRLSNWFIEVAVPQLSGWVTAGASWLITQLQAAVDAVVDLSIRLSNWFIEVAVPQLTGWIQSAAEDVSTKVKEAVGNPTVILSAMTVDLPGFNLGDISGALSSLVSSIKNAIEQAVGSLGGADVLDFATFTSGLGAQVHDVMVSAVAAIAAELKAVFTVDGFLQALDVVGTVGSMMLGVLAFVAVGIAGALVGFAFGEQVDFGQITQKIVDEVKGAFDDVSGIVGDITAAASAFMGSIWDAITSVFSGGGGGVNSMGGPGERGEAGTGAIDLSGLTTSINNAITAAFDAVTSNIPGLDSVIEAVQKVIDLTTDAIKKLKELGGGGAEYNPVNDPNSDQFDPHPDPNAPAGKGYSSLLLDVGKKGPFDDLIASANTAATELETAMGGIVLVVQSGMANISTALSGTTLAGDGGGTPGSLSPSTAGGGVLGPLIAQFTGAVPLVTAAMTSVATAVTAGMATITAALSGGGGQFNGAPGVPGQGGGQGGQGGGILAPFIAQFTAAVPLITAAMASVAAAVTAGMATITTAVSGGGGGGGPPALGGPGGGQGGGAGGGLLAPMIASFTAAAPLVSAAMTTIATAVTTGLTTIQTAIGSFAGQAGALMGQAMTNMQTPVTSGMTAMQTAMTTGLTTMQTAIGTFAGQTGALMGQAVTNMQTPLTTGMTTMTTAVNTATSAMSSDLQGFATNAGTAGSDAGTGFNDGLSSGLSTAAETARGGVADVIAALQTGVGDAYQAGYAIGDGFASGLMASVGAVQSAATALSNAASNTTTEYNGIHSPSTLYRKYGQFIGEGFGLGITDKAPFAADAALDMASMMDDIFAKIRSPRSPRTPMIPGFAGAGGTLSTSTTTHGDTFILDGKSFTPNDGDEERAFSLIGERLRQRAFAEAGG